MAFSTAEPESAAHQITVFTSKCKMDKINAQILLLSTSDLFVKDQLSYKIVGKFKSLNLLRLKTHLEAILKELKACFFCIKSLNKP